VVISDYFLKDMDGIEFLSKAAQIHPDATRILMATMTNGEMAMGIARTGIDQFIEKPITVDSLEEIIKELEMIKRSKERPDGKLKE
jgi:DNA-binding NtrC family response regulator